MSVDLINRVLTRVRLMVRGATITSGTDSDPSKIQKLQVQFNDNEVRDATIRVMEFGFTSLPLPGAKALVVAVSGDPNGGVIIATDDARYRVQGLAAGEVAVYDAFGHVVHLTATGIVIDGGGHDVNIINTPKLEVFGDIAAHGNIIDLSTSSSPKSMASMRAIHDIHTHPTGGPNTGVPNQQE